MSAQVHPTIDAWRMAGRELGIITFLDARSLATQQIGGTPVGFTGIGLCEADLLCVSDASGEMVVFDHEQAGRVFAKVAASQEAFLPAAALLEEHFAKCVESDAYFEDDGAALAVVEACAQAAGGSQYEGFYHLMAGV